MEPGEDERRNSCGRRRRRNKREQSELVALDYGVCVKASFTLMPQIYALEACACVNVVYISI